MLEKRGDAIALVGVGSVGRDRGRIDEYSDIDFFAVVEDDAKQRYLDSIDWLEELHLVVYSFRNTVDGRKALFADGIFAEYAVFTLDELRAGSFTPGRVVWQRPDGPAGLEDLGRTPKVPPHEDAEYQVNEALTNLYVGLQRDLRGERLNAMRFVQVMAVDRVLTFLDATGAATGPRQDPFVVERGAEKRFGDDGLPFSSFVPGYEHNREAALAILEWLEARADVDAVMAAAIRELAAG